MSTDLSLGRRSSVAELELLIDGKTFELAQAAPDFIILKRPAEISAGPAELRVRLDGRERIRQITIVNDVTGNETEIPISRG